MTLTDYKGKYEIIYDVCFVKMLEKDIFAAIN